MRGGKATIVTEEVLARIPAMLAEGKDVTEIAAEVGCKPGTLKVRCSERGISLRRPAGHRRVKRKQLQVAMLVPSLVPLSQVAMQRLLSAAALKGMTMNQLATELLEIIGKDNLFDAVLDNAA